jgi:hypothetical protein
MYEYMYILIIIYIYIWVNDNSPTICLLLTTIYIYYTLVGYQVIPGLIGYGGLHILPGLTIWVNYNNSLT